MDSLARDGGRANSHERPTAIDVDGTVGFAVLDEGGAEQTESTGRLSESLLARNNEHAE